MRVRRLEPSGHLNTGCDCVFLLRADQGQLVLVILIIGIASAGTFRCVLAKPSRSSPVARRTVEYGRAAATCGATAESSSKRA